MKGHKGRPGLFVVDSRRHRAQDRNIAKRKVLMKLYSVLMVSSFTLLVSTSGYSAELGQSRLLHEVDFENLPGDATSCEDIDNPEPTLANPLSVGGLILTDPFCLATGFCSSPSCIPDPDNADGGNISVFLNSGGTIEFEGRTKIAVLDVQGIGDNPFTLRVTDARGRTYDVQEQGVLFGQVLVPVVAPRGIQTIEVLEVGGTGGPLAIAAVYYR